jgi:hypothetical protein
MPPDPVPQACRQPTQSDRHGAAVARIRHETTFGNPDEKADHRSINPPLRSK